MLKAGVIRFSRLSFRIPGALLELDGSFELESERLDFRGKLHMDAKISQTTTGVKSLLLKAIDPFFRDKKGGSVIPIRISGTRGQPKYGLNL